MISKVSQNRTYATIFSRPRWVVFGTVYEISYVVSAAPLFFDYFVVTFGSARVVEMQTERQEKD